MAEWHTKDSIDLAEHRKPLGPGVMDSAFRAAVDSLRPFVDTRDSALALVRRDAGTANTDARFFAIEVRLDSLVQAWQWTLPNPSIVEWSNWGRPGINDSLRSFLATRSLRFRGSEGFMEMTVDHRSLSSLFGAYLSPVLQRYLVIVGGEDANPMFEDGGVELPWDSLGERAATWERFAGDNPGFARVAEARELYKTYRDAFIRGTGNSPIFPYEGDSTLAPDVRDTYDRFLKHHPGTATAKLLGDYLAVLKANNYIKTADVEAFYSRHQIARD